MGPGGSWEGRGRVVGGSREGRGRVEGRFFHDFHDLEEVGRVVFVILGFAILRFVIVWELRPCKIGGALFGAPGHLPLSALPRRELLIDLVAEEVTQLDRLGLA